MICMNATYLEAIITLRGLPTLPIARPCNASKALAASEVFANLIYVTPRIQNFIDEYW